MNVGENEFGTKHLYIWMDRIGDGPWEPNVLAAASSDPLFLIGDAARWDERERRKRPQIRHAVFRFPTSVFEQLEMKP